MMRFQKTQRSVARFCHDEGVSIPSFYHFAPDGGEKFLLFFPNLANRARAIVATLVCFMP